MKGWTERGGRERERVNQLLPHLQNDYRMREIMHIAHEFLQNFCRNNTTNQSLLHRHIQLFLQSGDSVSGPALYMYVCLYVCMYIWMDGWMYVYMYMQQVEHGHYSNYFLTTFIEFTL